MINDIFAHWYLMVIWVMLLAVAIGFLTFIIWSVLYFLFCGFNTAKFIWVKWVKRECPHICLCCKYKDICDLRNPP